MTDPNCTTLTKRCTHCGKVKPATPEFFARQKIGKYGLRADCKECHYERERVYRTSLPVKARKKSITERRKEMHHADPALCEQPNVLKRCIRCKEELPSTTQFFHRDGSLREGLAKVCKKCVKAHHEEYYKRQDIKARVKEYVKRPDVMARHRVVLNNRRSAEGSFTAADIEDIRKAQGNRCYICGKKLKKYHIDHFIPIALGGTNDPGNLRLACPHCNFSKNKKHPHAIGILI